MEDDQISLIATAMMTSTRVSARVIHTGQSTHTHGQENAASQLESGEQQGHRVQELLRSLASSYCFAHRSSKKVKDSAVNCTILSSGTPD